MTSEKLLRWVSWALVILAVAAAVLSVGISQGLLVKYPDVPSTTDFVERLVIIREADRQAYPLYLLSNIVGFAVFLVVSALGVALRPFAKLGSVRDVMATLFIVGGVLAVAGELVIAAVNTTATHTYCDCGYQAEEVIAQAKALDLGYTIQGWLTTGALVVIGMGAVLVGLLVNVGVAFKWLSFAIAGLLVLGAVLLVVGKRELSDLAVGLAAGIGVPIWAFMIGRAAPRLDAAATQSPA